MTTGIKLIDLIRGTDILGNTGYLLIYGIKRSHWKIWHLETLAGIY